MDKMKNRTDQPKQASIEFPIENERQIRAQSGSTAARPKLDNKVVSVVGVKQTAVRTMLITQLKKLGF